MKKFTIKFNLKGYIIALICVALFLISTFATIFVGSFSENNLPAPQAVASPNPADNTAKVEDIKVEFDQKGVPSVNIPAGFKAADKLYKKVLKDSDGQVVKNDHNVTVDYTGWTTDGNKFDSSYDRGQSASFSLSEVVKGWSEGLEGQKVGSTILLVIPPDLGYGSKAQDKIPAYSTLVFVVHIKEAK
ncbi:MAG: FKBP-type peptidyl-prolyl cis-trans isomerase [Bifidobacteriaceae bacterium]|jgi:FKBP-type peptidyl-prolyl cis-trans isomerase|nr:FKBP-type peptidyl-prolyl cis-trans isomerase [Bifidobacteriaceae bacterium]